MSKPKLTQNQKRRIQSNNNKVLHRHQKKDIDWQDEMLGDSQDGLVVTRYARHADVENAQGEIFRCNLRRTLASVVVGDRVKMKFPVRIIMTALKSLLPILIASSLFLPYCRVCR